MRILIDTNLLLDFLTKREPFFEDAEKIMKMCAEHKIQGCMAAHSVMNVFYILRKAYTLEERRKMLLCLCDVLHVVSIDQDKITRSLYNIDFKDMEDCLQTECAADFQADYIVTRNIKDFSTSQIRAVTPDTFVRLV